MQTIDLNQNGFFTGIYNFIVGVIRDCLSFLDHIMIGNFSLLDLSIAILAMGLIITITLSTVHNFASAGITGSENLKMKNEIKKNHEYIKEEQYKHTWQKR